MFYYLQTHAMFVTIVVLKNVRNTNALNIFYVRYKHENKRNVHRVLLPPAIHRVPFYFPANLTYDNLRTVTYGNIDSN